MVPIRGIVRDPPHAMLSESQVASRSFGNWDGRTSGLGPVPNGKELGKLPSPLDQMVPWLTSPAYALRMPSAGRSNPWKSVGSATRD